MNDDIHTQLLDIEFRQILYIIKPFINKVDDHYRLERYRVWLERLSSVYPSEKLERNRYLLELANQIHDQTLKFPFTKNPTKDKLPCLKTIMQMEKTGQNPEKISEHFFQQADLQWPYISPRRAQNEDAGKKQAASKDSPTICFLSQRKKTSKTKTVQPFQKIGKKEDTRSDTSWCDLTDSTLGGDPDIDISQKNKSFESHNSKTDTVVEEGSRPTQQELEALKMRMKDLLEVKNALKGTQYLTEDRKKTIDALHMKLSRVQQENIELRTLLDAQQKKFVELDQMKSKEISELKDKYSLLRQKEIEYLNQTHKNEISDLEKLYIGKINEMEASLGNMRMEYEQKIHAVKDSSMSMIKQKEKEIEMLNSELKLKSSQIANEGKGEQVIGLRRCISKLDKVLHKNEKDYTKKIEKLRKEIEVKEMTSQMQLQTQRAELIVRNNAAKQEQLTNAVNSLEGKYRKMMETLKTHAIAAKKQDEKIIDELKELLDKNNISY